MSTLNGANGHEPGRAVDGPPPRSRVTITEAIEAANKGRHQEAIALAMICQAQEFYWIGKHMRTLSEDLNKCLCELTRITETLEEARFGGDVLLEVKQK